MVDVQELKQFLEEEYNITNLQELEKAIAKTEPINIGVFVAPVSGTTTTSGNKVGEK